MERLDRKRIISLPRTIVEEALSGGFSSLWLPVEIGYLPDATDYSVSMPSGSRFLMVGLSVQGTGWFEYGKTRHPLERGRAWIAVPGIPFSYGSEGDTPWTHYWFHVTGARIAWFRSLLLGEGGVPVFPVRDMVPLASLLRKTLDILERGLSKRNLDCASLVFGHMMAELRLGRRAEADKSASVGERLDRVVDWLRDNAEGSIDVKELAAMCGLSPSYFAACFRQRTGNRVLDYFLRLKMEKAGEMLKDPGVPVKEIAARLGFSDQLYFSRSFKRIYGCPPLSWRAGNQSSEQGEKTP